MFMNSRLAILAICGVVANTAPAQLVPDFRLTSGLEPGLDKRFGVSVAIGQDGIVVGDIGTFEGVTALGAAYVFDPDTGAFRFPLDPTFPDPDNTGQYGNDAAIFGDLAIIGARRSAAQAAFVFDVSTGEQLLALQPERPRVDLYGTSVDINDRYALVGSVDHSAFVFDLETGRQLHEFTDPSQSDFGKTVQLHDTLAVVGAPGDDTFGRDVGAAHVFDLSTGQQLFTLRPPTFKNEERFGSNIAISEDRIFVDSRQSNKVYAFDHSGKLLNQVTLPSYSGVSNTLAVANGLLAVGEISSSVQLLDAHTLELVVAIEVPGGATSVALFGERLVVGADDEAYVYTIPEPTGHTWMVLVLVGGICWLRGGRRHEP
jgi:outer membrane protein assembly factor BamB